MSKPTYARATRVLWRIAGDRVIVRTMDEGALGSEAEVTGSAAVVWLSLDHPQHTNDLEAALATAGSTDPAGELQRALALLGENALIVTHTL